MRGGFLFFVHFKRDYRAGDRYKTAYYFYNIHESLHVLSIRLCMEARSATRKRASYLCWDRFYELQNGNHAIGLGGFKTQSQGHPAAAFQRWLCRLPAGCRFETSNALSVTLVLKLDLRLRGRKS